MILRTVVACCTLLLILHAAGVGQASELSFVAMPFPLTSEAQKTQGVAGGEGFQKVMSLVYAPSDASRVYLASDTSQIWRSLDGGWHWGPCNNGYHALGSSSLFVHPADPRIVFSAANLGKTQKRRGDADQHQGIYRTLDGGDSWEFMREAVYYKQESCGALFAVDSRTLSGRDYTIFTGQHDGGILVSRDSGTTWEDTGVNKGRVLDMLEHPGRPGAILVCTDKGLFLYENGEMTKQGAGLPAPPLNIAGSAGRPDVIYAAVGTGGVFISEDGGVSFERSLSGSALNARFTDVEVSPVNPDIVIANMTGKRGGPYCSRDGGRSWNKASDINSRGLTPGKGFFYTSPLAMHPNDAEVALTCSNGKARVLRTENGGATWFYSGSGYLGGRLECLQLVPGVGMIFGLTDHGAWLTRDAGESFSFLGHPALNGMSVGDIAVKGDTIVLSVGGWKRKGLLISRSKGTHWDHVSAVNGSLQLVRFHKSRPHTIYAGGFRSDDNGQNWHSLGHEVAAVDPSDNDVVYALGNKGEKQQVLVSRDRGETWGRVPEKGLRRAGRIMVLAVDPFQSGRLVAGMSRGVMIFESGVWRKMDTAAMKDAFGSEYVSELALHPTIPGLIFAGKRSPGKGMGNGLWYSADCGTSWAPIALGAVGLNTGIFSINCLPDGSSVYVGTSHGVFKVDVKEIR